jgi:uncharacterized protein (TIGR00725 family)
MRRIVVGIVGAGAPSEQHRRNARELGRLVAERGWIVLTGGRPAGVMAAACAGAKEVPGSLTLGILPADAGGVDPQVDVAVFTGLGDARNVINVLTSDAVVACGVEGPGTASAVAHALKADKPVVLVAAGPQAIGFFAGLQGGERIATAATPADAVRALETLLAPRSAAQARGAPPLGREP